MEFSIENPTFLNKKEGKVWINIPIIRRNKKNPCISCSKYRGGRSFYFCRVAAITKDRYSTGSNKRGNFKSPAKFDWKKIVDEMKMVVCSGVALRLCRDKVWIIYHPPSPRLRRTS